MAPTADVPAPDPDDDPAEFPSAAEFDRWLEEHHASSPGVWLKLRKKAQGISALDYAQALDVALCHGWIDGRKRSLDATHWLQRFTPRAARSRWSRVNRDKVTALLAEGRVRPWGLAEVERAKADGRWDAAYQGMKGVTVPEDLARALAAEPAADAFFATLDKKNRYSVLHRVEAAKRPETRARRIATLVAMLAEGEKLYP
ncbi:YdeI/OmpD-associated family protein [Streptomyces avicenniae]|uniref:YdeI/OmpD-associated family protein n=1 Tax=Streptomyces avicenniae TaxID=500153 RepID=UPI000B0AA698|nr:YdeI/OmpD-associated family protein [Streptomyces avicenniae]